MAAKLLVVVGGVDVGVVDAVPVIGVTLAATTATAMALCSNGSSSNGSKSNSGTSVNEWMDAPTPSDRMGTLRQRVLGCSGDGCLCGLYDVCVMSVRPTECADSARADDADL